MKSRSPLLGVGNGLRTIIALPGGGFGSGGTRILSPSPLSLLMSKLSMAVLSLILLVPVAVFLLYMGNILLFVVDRCGQTFNTIMLSFRMRHGWLGGGGF